MQIVLGMLVDVAHQKHLGNANHRLFEGHLTLGECLLSKIKGKQLQGCKLGGPGNYG